MKSGAHNQTPFPKNRKRSPLTSFQRRKSDNFSFNFRRFYKFNHLQPGVLGFWGFGVFFSPDGLVFKQGLANQLSLCDNMIFICGHYKGIDERIREKYVTKEISIGDYVLSGGELAAAVCTDAIIRLIPGAIGDEMSALTDSFQDGLLAPPVYTRPAMWEGMEVPEILRSGNDKKIDIWRHEQAVLRTQTRRPDLLDSHE